VLAGESGWFGGGGHDQATPRQPVLEVGHRVVGEVGAAACSPPFRGRTRGWMGSGRAVPRLWRSCRSRRFGSARRSREHAARDPYS
jgi:hypothetical protein